MDALVKIASGAGGRSFLALCGRIWLYSFLQKSINTLTYSNLLGGNAWNSPRCGKQRGLLVLMTRYIETHRARIRGPNWPVAAFFSLFWIPNFLIFLQAFSSAEINARPSSIRCQMFLSQESSGSGLGFKDLFQVDEVKFQCFPHWAVYHGRQ